jgi:hypothetical protein
MEVVLLSVRGSRAALTPAGAAGVAEGAPGALVVLAVEGTAGVGVLDTGGIPVHLLLGPFSGPTSAQGWNDDRSPAEKTLMRRRLLRRTTAKTAKDQKTSSRAVSGEGRDHVHVSSIHFHAEQEDKSRRLRTIHATPTGRRPVFTVPT